MTPQDAHNILTQAVNMGKYTLEESKVVLQALHILTPKAEAEKELKKVEK